LVGPRWAGRERQIVQRTNGPILRDRDPTLRASDYSGDPIDLSLVPDTLADLEERSLALMAHYRVDGV
jgi:hypothetical protein